MEGGAIVGEKLFRSSIEITFNCIDSPQYFNFANGSAEAKDSYFDFKSEDEPAAQPSAKKLQKLPIDFGDDLIRIQDTGVKEECNSIRQKNNNVIQTPTSDFGDDLISAVQTLELNRCAGEPKAVVTSTPFRVKGVEPMPWKPSAKPEMRHCTQTRPFSFEERNKQMRQRKAQRIQTILQAEKEARKFRAQPVPKFLKKSSSIHPTLSSILNLEKKTGKGTEAQLHSSAPPIFKAKSPKVLRRPPFQPILPRQPLPPPQPFALSSELRAKDRELFDNYIKEKERLDMRLQELREAAQKRREEEEIAKMRKERVIKAQPVRKYKRVVTPVKKRPPTDPITPRVMKRQRR